eukprot:scaffold7909_cov36-Tisochrysis_lutea.AAC.1
MAAGSKSPSSASLPWTCRRRIPAPDKASTNSDAELKAGSSPALRSATTSKVEASATPRRCLTVTSGASRSSCAAAEATASSIASQHAAACAGSRIIAAPEARSPPATAALGQPQFRLIASYPSRTPIAAALASVAGSWPPSCSTTGPSSSSRTSYSCRSTCSFAPPARTSCEEGIISVYKCELRLSSRKK